MAEKRKRKLSSRRSSCDLPDSSQISGTSSCVSLKSDSSMFMPPEFHLEIKQNQSSQISGTSSCVSLKSDSSMFMPPEFHLEKQQNQSQPAPCSVCRKVSSDPVQFVCGHWSCIDCVESDSPSSNPQCPECGKKLKERPGVNNILQAKKNLKIYTETRFSMISEGIGDQKTSLESIYTTLYITPHDDKGPNGKHEFRHLKGKPPKQQMDDDSVNLRDLFKPRMGQEKPHRTVLTKGVAGIGKSFAVQKFILDWAKEEANQDVDFVFTLAFRELNLSKGEKNLHELLTDFHPALHLLKGSDDFTKTKILVVLDGLDESRLHLDFNNMKTVRSLWDVTSVGNLLLNLVQGNLLPDANLWITSRPAAANQIPAKYIDVVTEIRGFTDAQKVEYFRRRFSEDLSLADRITSHIKSSQSLDIMCQIPIFCWISAVLFQEVFGGGEETEIPQTLTEMMAHFLFVQTKRRGSKYEMKAQEQEREFLLKLGRLAFVHLQENKLIFYEEDLENCGIDIKEASVYSGFFNTVVREERVFCQKQIFFFVHLTVQEFFAALYVYHCFTTRQTKELKNFLSLDYVKDHSLLDLVKMTIDQVLKKENGQLDFFLRFLLGLMVEPNQRVLQGLLEPLDQHDETEKKILTYLRSIRRKTLSPESCITIIQVLVEMRDHKVKVEIEDYLKQTDRHKQELSPLHCSVLAFMLQVSKDELEELDLKSYNTSDEGRRRLIPAVRSSKKAVLNDCKVTLNWLSHLAFGLKFPLSPLQDLDLSNNDLWDEGVERLCDGLSSQCCRLKALRLSGCLVTEKGCESLAKALQSNPSHLIELDLSYNNPGDSGVKQLTDVMEKPQYKLNKLKFEKGGADRMKPGFKKYSCDLTLDSNTAHRNLHLSEGNRKATWVKEEQRYHDHTERFDQCLQVLCEQGLKERCYFQVEVVEPFSVGLAYKSISRKGKAADCSLGQNDKSWCATFTESGCWVQHKGQRITVACLRCTHIGVYLDWEAGRISFYRVSNESRTHLYTFKGEAFSDALHPALELHPHSSAVFQ